MKYKKNSDCLKIVFKWSHIPGLVTNELLETWALNCDRIWDFKTSMAVGSYLTGFIFVELSEGYSLQIITNNKWENDRNTYAQIQAVTLFSCIQTFEMWIN